MLFVVTGSPRSGTQYVARLMAAMGFPCDHEKTLRPPASVVDLIRWPGLDIGEASWMAWCVLPLMVGHRIPVLHVVRNPWDVIDSLTNRNYILNPLAAQKSTLQSVREMINVYLPDVFTHEQRVDRAAALVVGWNRLIAEHVQSRFLFHVESLDLSSVRELLHFIGERRDDAVIDTALSEVSTTANSGYTVDRVPGISNRDVAEWVAFYAKQQGVDHVSTLKIRDVAGRQTPEELAEAMSPDLLVEVNEYAGCHGYQRISIPELAVA